MPNRLYMMTEMVITATYGSPCAKYSVGIHAHGEEGFIIKTGLNECVILNEVKNLETLALCIQILRDAQDDTIGV